MKLSEYINIKLRNVFINEPYKSLSKIYAYTSFLTQELNLGMFVPAKLVDGKWNVLEEPKETDYKNKPLYKMDVHRYKKAKENVIFDGFLYNKGTDDNFENVSSDDFVIRFNSRSKPLYHYHKTVEDIINKVELTDEVKKRFKIC